MTRLAFSVLWALALVACAQSNLVTERASNAPVTVTVLVFSGRPDPSWQLTQPQEVQAVLTRLANLPAAPDPHWTDPLGYRGMALSRTGAGDWETARVWQGVVALTRQGRTTYYQDTAGLEVWLQAQARAHGWANVLP